MATKQRTTPENLAKIEAFVARAENLMLQLYSRWSHEKDHESLSDYKVPLEKILPEGWRITGMYARPFSFRFVIGTEAHYRVYIKNSCYGWDRVD
jgi:hypothetical protein